MALKGGYQIIDLQYKKFTLGTGMVYEGRRQSW